MSHTSGKSRQEAYQVFFSAGVRVCGEFGSLGAITGCSDVSVTTGAKVFYRYVVLVSFSILT